MKKVKLFTSVLVMALALVFAGCKHEMSEPDTPTEPGTTSESEILHVPDDFVRINGGTFDEADSTGTFHIVNTVTIKDFYICSHEVTQKEYEMYCNYTGDNSPSDEYGRGENYPAYYVSWYDAILYCNRRSLDEGLTPCYSIRGETNPDQWGEIPVLDPWADNIWNRAKCNWNANGYRLPTREEWLYAARNENLDDYMYSGSNAPGDIAWYEENSDLKFHEVKTKAPNGKGLYDMSGNVEEWTWTYDTQHHVIVGTIPCDRLLLGGEIYSDQERLKLEHRVLAHPAFRMSTSGFRVVRSIL
ncbi:MAG: formylglycine-generating enzyme family protein [Treponema sp.]|nr:formylglycine-generating enzyme family protein [Treponema sp.]